MIQLFHKLSERCSQITTEQYSTSFASAIGMLHRDIRQPVYNIYGFVRLADEIVDSFHNFDKAALLKQFQDETYCSIQTGLSLNPILHSFQSTVKQYGIDLELIQSFFSSMEMDLEKSLYDHQAYSKYIYGSAEVVGLMCLYIFCEGDSKLYNQLKPAAQSLGAAFQKVNFLRDMKSDYTNLNRIYFPGVDFSNFTVETKKTIEKDIDDDFKRSYLGILGLPWKARFGVYVAYKYYLSLFFRIKRIHASKLMRQRIRIPNYIKAIIVARATVKNQLKLIA